MTSRAIITTLAFALVSAGCMKDEGRSDTVSTGTNIESLHPSGMDPAVHGTADSECSAACYMLDECGYLEGLSLSECVNSCEQGGMDGYLSCILAASDCYEIGDCFY